MWLVPSSPQGGQCAALGLQASSPELSKVTGSRMGTVQKQFIVAGDKLQPRGGGIPVYCFFPSLLKPGFLLLSAAACLQQL